MYYDGELVRLRDAVFINGQYQDLLIMSILEEEMPKGGN